MTADVRAAVRPAVQERGASEYAFEVELRAVVRVRASSYCRAREVVEAIEAYDVNAPLDVLGASAHLTEVSVSSGDGGVITVFEKNGEPI